jgi:hypothetical protein
MDGTVIESHSITALVAVSKTKKRLFTRFRKDTAYENVSRNTLLGKAYVEDTMLYAVRALTIDPQSL